MKIIKRIGLFVRYLIEAMLFIVITLLTIIQTEVCVVRYLSLHHGLVLTGPLPSFMPFNWGIVIAGALVMYFWADLMVWEENRKSRLG